MSDDTVTTWPITPAQAESLKGRDCEVCKGVGQRMNKLRPSLHVVKRLPPNEWESLFPGSWNCKECKNGRVRPPQVVAEVENVPAGTETIENYRDGIWRAYRNGHMIGRVEPCPFGPIGGVCEAVVRLEEDCRRCDGCGWYEGGTAIQTGCEECGGDGHKRQPIARFRVAAVEVKQAKDFVAWGAWTMQQTLQHLPRGCDVDTHLWIATVEWKEGAR